MPELKTCSVTECNSVAACRGWCRKHYQRWRKHGDPETSIVELRPKVCVIEGCDRPVNGHGLCGAHYNRNMRHGSPTGGGPERGKQDDECKVLGCAKKPKARNLCPTHWKQWRSIVDPTYKEKRKAEWERWYADNRERVAANNARYSAANRSHKNAQLREWKAENPWHGSFYSYTKRRRKYGHPDLIVDMVDPNVVFARDNGFCMICGELIDRTIPFPEPWSFTIDHVIPVVNPVSEHSYANTQASHWDCNRRKQATALRQLTQDPA